MDPVQYPVNFSVDYPDRDLNRLTTFFRIFTVIPIAIVARAARRRLTLSRANRAPDVATPRGALVVLPTVLMILFRQKYPRWWFDWNLELMRFGNRIGVYFALMDDDYPSTDEQQSVHLDFPYPDAENDLGRGMPLVKWLLAIPHYIVLFFLGIGAFFAVIGAWFAILFTGRYPRGIFNFVEGSTAGTTGSPAYAFTLVTDRYPPFSSSPDRGPRRRGPAGRLQRVQRARPRGRPRPDASRTVDWPNAWEGGRVSGRDAVAAYWARQFEQISSRVEPAGLLPGGGRRHRRRGPPGRPRRRHLASSSPTRTSSTAGGSSRAWWCGWTWSARHEPEPAA